MMDAIYSKLAQIGFQGFDSGFCVGTWKNYAVTLRRYAGKTYYVNLAIRDGKLYKGLKKTLNGAIKAAGIKRSAVANVQPNTITATFSFTGGAENEVSEFTAYLDVLTAALQESGVGPADRCGISGAPQPDSLCLLLRNDCFGFQPVCASVLRQEEYARQEKVEENENNGSYLTGLLGALLGALVGVGVNLLTMVFLERIFALLFALVPVAAMYGYKLFKGKTNKASLIIVIVLSLIAVPVMELLTGAIALVQEYQIPFGMALSTAWELFREPEVLKQMLPEMLKLLLFMVLGFFISFSYLRGSLNSTQAGKVRLQLESLRPNPLYAAPQSQHEEITEPAEQQE